MQNLWKLKNSCFFGTDSELKNMIWWHHSISTNNAPAWIAHCISTWIFYRALQKYETFDLWLAFCLLAVHESNIPNIINKDYVLETLITIILFFWYNLEPFVIQRSTLPFRGEEPNFQEQLQNFEVAAAKFNIDHHSTSTTSKGQSENLKRCCGIIPFFP